MSLSQASSNASHFTKTGSLRFHFKNLLSQFHSRKIALIESDHER